MADTERPPDPEPGSLRGMARDTAWLVGTGYAAQLFTLVLAVGLRRVLGPEAVGHVALLLLIATYAPYLTLGIAQAAEREIAMELGSGQTGVAEQLERALAAAMSGAAALVVAIACVAALCMEGDDRIVLVAGAVVVAVQQLTIYSTVRLRTRVQFRPIAIWSAIGGVLASCLTLAGAVMAGMAGAIAGTCVGLALQGALFAKASGVEWGKPARIAMVRLATRAPGFLAVGISVVLLSSIDQIAVGAFLGASSLGLYSTAYLGNQFIVRLPTLIGSAIMPRLQREYGLNGDLARMASMSRRTSAATALIIGPMTATVVSALPVFISVVLPVYTPAIVPMRLLLIGVVGLALSIAPSYFLTAAGRPWTVALISAAVGGGMAVIYVGLAMAGRLTIDAAAAIHLVAYVVYAGALEVVSGRTAGIGSREGLVNLAWAVAPLGALLAAVTCWESGGHGDREVAGVVAFAAFTATWVPTTALQVRRQRELRQDLASMASRLRALGARR